MPVRPRTQLGGGTARPVGPVAPTVAWEGDEGAPGRLTSAEALACLGSIGQGKERPGEACAASACA